MRPGRAGSGLCSRGQTCSPSQESCPQLGFLQKETLARRCLSQGDGREMYKNLSQDSQEPRHQPQITWGQWTGDTEVSWSSSDPCWRPDVRGQRSPLASPTCPSTDVQYKRPRSALEKDASEAPRGSPPSRLLPSQSPNLSLLQTWTF